MARKRLITTKASLSKEEKFDKTAALRSPRWVQFDGGSADSSDSCALGVPPVLRTKLKEYYMRMTPSASTATEESLATVRTCELGLPPIWERKRQVEGKPTVVTTEFVDYELGEDTSSVVVKKDLEEDNEILDSSPRVQQEQQVQSRGDEEHSPDDSSDDLEEGDDGTKKAFLEEEKLELRTEEKLELRTEEKLELRTEETLELRDGAEEICSHDPNNVNTVMVAEAQDAIRQAEGALNETPTIFSRDKVKDPLSVDHQGTNEDTKEHEDHNVNPLFVDEVTFHDTSNNIRRAISSGDDIFPHSPPHEILINKNTSIRSNLNDYQSEIDVLDQLIEKYANHEEPPPVDDDDKAPPSLPGTASALECGSSAVPEDIPLSNSNEKGTGSSESSPETDPAPNEDVISSEKILLDPIDTTPEGTWSIVASLESLANSAKSSIQEMIGKCTGTATSGNMFSFDSNELDGKQGCETLSNKTENSDQSSLVLQKSATSVVNVGEPTFVPVAVNIVKANETTAEVMRRGKSGKLVTIRKAFMKVFNREQKRQQRRLHETSKPNSKKAMKQKRTTKRWWWRTGRTIVHDPQFVGSACEVSLRK